MRNAAIAVALALAVSTLGALAQDAGGPPPSGGGQGGPGGGRGPGQGGQGGFHLLPPRAVEQLNLTAEQQKQIADLEADVKAKLEKILTPAQQEQMKQMRPPQRQGGRSGGGPGQGGQGAPGGARPPSEQSPKA